MQDSNKLTCPNHPDKESAFYCFKHSTLACLRCVSVHVQCQLENQFQPLEEIFETLQQDIIKQKETISSELQDYGSKIQDNQNKVTILDSLKSLDIQAIQDYFEDLKKKAEEMKQKAIENYEARYAAALSKVQANNKSYAQSFNRKNEQFAKLEQIQENIQELTTVQSKKAKAIELFNEVEQVKLEARNVVDFKSLDHEVDTLMSQEEVFSEIGHMTLVYSQISSKVSNFVNEQMPEYIKGLDALAKAKKDEEERNDQETLEDKLGKIEYLKDENQVYEDNFFKVLEEADEIVPKKNNTRLHQLRFCSNEVNVFDCVTGKFTCYELFTTNSYKTPFYIFNSCGSALYKNHLVFLFGGEDPVLNDKSSNRVFCFNLDHANADNQIVVYEISQMSNARQEFSLATIDNSIYIVSGYDTNKSKDYRVIPKCERLDVKSKTFCDMRDINYPRQGACSLNVNNTHIYVFGGQNPKYLDFYVDKIERYAIKLNDWSVVKYSIMNDFTYEAGMNAAAFRMNATDVIILGGQRGSEVLNGYYVFDMRKLLFVKKEEKFLKEADNFYNQNDIETDLDEKEPSAVKVFSGNRVNHIYNFGVKDLSSYLLSVSTISDNPDA